MHTSGAIGRIVNRTMNTHRKNGARWTAKQPDLYRKCVGTTTTDMDAHVPGGHTQQAFGSRAHIGEMLISDERMGKQHTSD